jgi:AraC family transcriptional regulator, regulatory protein of adaptative response / methylated-DNA-[protein]-cysteine methyltransferase
MHDSGGPLPLPQLATMAHCSARQLQRDFMEILGVTPRSYGQCVRSTRARTALTGATRVTDAMYDAGYGSVRAFYEQASLRLGMNPRDFADGAPHQLLLWSATQSPLGEIIAIASASGLCAVAIGDSTEIFDEVSAPFRHAVLTRDDEAMSDVMRALALIAAGRPAPELPLHVQGTAFQARVWAALRTIPIGETRTYSEVAQQIGDPTAVRAVANACGANPTALSVPCHRVIRTDGSLGGYHWGLEVKEELLAREGSR